MKEVAALLKAIHAQESKEAAKEKASMVARKLSEMKL
jgi:putative transposase